MISICGIIIIAIISNGELYKREVNKYMMLQNVEEIGQNSAITIPQRQMIET